MAEMASTYARIMVEILMNIHALTNMHRVSENDEYRKSAADWLSKLEDQMKSLRRELEAKI